MGLSWAVRAGKKLAQMLLGNNVLALLDAGRTGVEGTASDFAAVLSKSKSLTSLDLRDNKFGAEDAKLLGRALRSNKVLTTLDLRGNKIGRTGASHLAEALKVNNSLTSLNLCGNNLGEGGSVSLAEALTSNYCMRMLDLSGTAASRADTAAWLRTLQLNTSLTSLELRFNRLTEEDVDLLEQLLKKNKEPVLLLQMQIQEDSEAVEQDQPPPKRHRGSSLQERNDPSSLSLRFVKMSGEEALVLPKVDRTITLTELQLLVEAQLDHLDTRVRIVLPDGGSPLSKGWHLRLFEV